MTKTRFLVFLTVLALLASVSLTSVLAQQPPRPQNFYGTVMVDGVVAPEGTMVTAMVGEGEDEMKFEDEVDADGMYALRLEGDFVGEDIMFIIGERMGMAETMDADGMMMMENSVMFMEGGSGTLNLSAGVTPTRPTTGTGGTGARGLPGKDGEDGADGAPGATGARGAQGPAGDDGAPGADGASGADGARGPAGADGSNGSDGNDGSNGSQGPAGPAGADGAAGADGQNGAAGADGGGGILAIIALIIAIVGVVAAGGAFIMGRRA